MKQLVKKIKINTTITLLTGMHIGGSKENVEIGGIDTPVIKLASKKDQPYIPGSSLKGKMRCLLEQVAGSPEVGGDAAVNNMFGITEKKGTPRPNRPSKIIVRDAYLTDKSLEMLDACTTLDMPYTENKFENTIDRIKGVAEHPRQIERVPAGAEFAVEFIINVWDDDKEAELLAMLKKGIALIENDYLGGNGSRGYGQVKFGDLAQETFSPENNWKA